MKMKHKHNQRYSLEIRGIGVKQLRDKDLSEEIALNLEEIGLPLNCYVRVEKEE